MKKLKQTKYISGRESFFIENKKKHPIIPLIIILVVISLLSYIIIKGLRMGQKPVLTKVTVESDQLPKSFDGYKILQISDIYGKEFGDRQSKIRALLEGEDYDMVLFTGDYMGDVKDSDYWVLRDILDCLKEDVPIYFILGDNDYTPSNVSSSSDKWKMCIIPPYSTAIMNFFIDKYNATFVYPAQIITNTAGDSIFLTGISYDKEILNELDFDPDLDFSICVTHKPINYDVTKRLKDVNKRTLTEVDFDLLICGHTCGNQYSMPILGTFYQADEGWFPQENKIHGLSEDSAGRYTFINGGLGVESGFRIYSNPEIAIIELKCPEE